MKKRIFSVISMVLVLAVVLSSFAGISVSALQLTRPRVTSVTTDCASVTIKWTYEDEEDVPVTFFVYRKDAKDGAKWARVGTTKPDATAYKDKTVKPEKTYYYTVKAYYKAEDGTKYLSKSSGDYKIKIVPAKPDYKLISNCGTGVVMQWAERKDATGFALYRSPTAAKGSWTRIATIKSNKAGQFIDTKVNIGETYYYCFKTYKTVNGKNYYSDISKIYKKVISDVAVPETLETESTSKGVLFSYSKVPGTQGYAIYRRDAGQSNWKRIATQKSVNKLQYLDKTVEAGKKYYYTVKSYKTVNGKTVYSAGAQSVPAVGKIGVLTIDVSVGEIIFSELLEKQVIRIYVDGAPKYDTLKFEIEDKLVAAGTWGKWNGNTIDLTVTRVGPGDTWLRIYYESNPDAEVMIPVYAAKLDLDDDYILAKDYMAQAYGIFSDALELLTASQKEDITEIEKAQLISQAVEKIKEASVLLEKAGELAEKYAEYSNDDELISSLSKFAAMISDFINVDSLDGPMMAQIIGYLNVIIQKLK